MNKLTVSVKQAYIKGGWVIPAVSLGAIALFPAAYRGTWQMWCSVLFAIIYGSMLVINEYHHPQSAKHEDYWRGSSLIKLLSFSLIVYTLGPWLLLKWGHIQSELPWLLLVWAIGVFVYLTVPKRHK